MKTDPRAVSNNARFAHEWMMPILRERLAAHLAATIVAIFEKHGLPFAPNTRPQDLLDDPHLSVTGGLVPITLPGGKQTRAPLLPLMLDGQRPRVRLNPPKLGEYNEEVLLSLGYSEEQIRQMIKANIISGQNGR